MVVISFKVSYRQKSGGSGFFFFTKKKKDKGAGAYWIIYWVGRNETQYDA